MRAEYDRANHLENSPVREKVVNILKSHCAPSNSNYNVRNSQILGNANLVTKLLTFRTLNLKS